MNMNTRNEKKLGTFNKINDTTQGKQCKIKLDGKMRWQFDLPPVLCNNKTCFQSTQ